ncbi:MAG: GxxExxY protein [Kiritimatiellae bacterium]|nr:GxxExxY protein [Kiritimatiellia bacterium]
MDENTITGDILDAAVKLHRHFGPGLLESVYEQLLAIELVRRGHTVERQKPISFEYEGTPIENAFRLDLLVDGKVVVELKSTDQMHPVYAKQVKTYLVLMDLQVGLLVNFGMNLLKDGILRIVNHYQGPPPSSLRASASPRKHPSSLPPPPLRASAPPREQSSSLPPPPLRASAPPREQSSSLPPPPLRASAPPREHSSSPPSSLRSSASPREQPKALP